jgi:translation initiation factor IF-2
LSSSGISVKELAAKIACTPTDIVKLLFMKGVILQINEEIDRSMVNMICEAKGVEVRDPKKSTKSVYPGDKIQNEHDIEFMAARAPIVTIMGHVDHGKTSFLDYVRKSKVAAGESGGITQITSSYSVEIKNEKTNNNVNTLCFLDTPGHEAFSAMRSRGVKVTDIVIIIIAADDGVKPQTLESIQHAKDVSVPVVVAISKIDKKEADQQKVMSQLAEVELLPEEWGGQTTVVGISSKNGQGIPDLLENILLLADIKDLIANPFRPAIGIVLEAFLDNSRGPIVTVIIKTGTIRVGDSIQAGNTYGRVRTLRNEMGIAIDKAFPSSFLTLLGLNSVPRAGQILEVFPSEIVARQRAESISTIERRKYNFTETSASIFRP